jgi:hypothetical protein
MALGLEELAVASSCEVLPLSRRKKIISHYFRWTTPLGVAPLRELKALRAVRIEGCLRRDERLRGLPGTQCTCAGARQACRGSGKCCFTIHHVCLDGQVTGHEDRPEGRRRR